MPLNWARVRASGPLEVCCRAVGVPFVRQSGVGHRRDRDGAYLAEFLLNKGDTVHGVKRRPSSFNTERVDHLYQDPHETNVQFFLHYGRHDGRHQPDPPGAPTRPDKIYNLAA